MPATVNNLKLELLEEFAPVMAVSGMTPEMLNGPIRKAVIQGGGTVADPPNVTDSDVQTAAAGFDTLVGFAKLYLIRKFLGNYARVDMKSGEESQSLSQLADRMQALQLEVKEEIADPDDPLNVVYSGPPAIGVIEEGATVPCRPYPWF